jgi:hypothetical protein
MMDEMCRTFLHTETASAALLAAVTAAAVLIPTFWLIGVIHFGFVTAPDPTTPRLVSYMVWTTAPGILVLAYILQRYIRKRTSRELGDGRALITAAVVLAPVQAATWWVTLYQYGSDELVVIGALLVALTAEVVLAELLSITTDRDTQAG